jgi:hypothetical protein
MLMRGVMGLCLVVVSVVVGMTLGGCSSGPKGWPSSIDGRSVRDKGVAWMYAASGSSADSVGAMALKLAADFERETGRLPAKGVIIVTEIGERPAGVSSVQEGAADAIREAARSSGNEIVASELDRQAEDLAALVSVAAWGRSLEGALGVPEIVRLETPWIVSLPSSRAIETAFDRASAAAAAGVASAPDVGMPGRILIRSGLKMAKSEFVIRVRDVHRATLWKAMVESDAGLSADERMRLRNARVRR